jgi:hypothetical protein
MLSNCSTSCDSLEKQKLEDVKEIASIESFFGLKANDIHGKQISFKEFEGKVTLVSVCLSNDRYYYNFLSSLISPSYSVFHFY